MLDVCSNNTNKLSPQELLSCHIQTYSRSNNTNKLSPQERMSDVIICKPGSNNTNKLSPQEPKCFILVSTNVQIIQINLVLKNSSTSNCLPVLFK